MELIPSRGVWLPVLRRLSLWASALTTASKQSSPATSDAKRRVFPLVVLQTNESVRVDSTGARLTRGDLVFYQRKEKTNVRHGNFAAAGDLQTMAHNRPSARVVGGRAAARSN